MERRQTIVAAQLRPREARDHATRVDRGQGGWRFRLHRRHRQSRGILAASLGIALLWPAFALAVPAGQATFIIDVQVNGSDVTSCVQGTYADATYDVFGTMLNLGTSVGGFVCYANPGVPVHCASSPVDMLFNYDTNFVLLCPNNNCITTTDSFISDPTVVTGSAVQALTAATFVFDGTTIYVGSGSPSNIPGCALSGSVLHFTGQLGVNAFEPAPTAAGSNVPVSTSTTFFNPITNTSTPVSVDLTFSNVSGAGATTVTASSNTAATLNSNFAAAIDGYQAAFIDVTTTATFEGPVTICTSYPDADDDGIIDGTSYPESALSFLHEEGNPLIFVDRTVSRDPVNNIICAQVTSFSHFVPAIRTNAVCTTPGAACDDGDVCTTNDQCDGSLNCVGTGLPPDCDDGSVCTVDSCVSPGGCVHTAAPATGCLPASKSLLKLVRTTGKPEKDHLLFKWLKGPALSQSAFGDPTTSDGYSLCVFDARGVAAAADVSPGGTCGNKSCWRAVGTKGYAYADSAGAQEGITAIKLLGNETQPKSKVLVIGKGDALPDAPLALVGPVTAQVIRDTPGLCFEATYSDGTTIKKNDTQQFKGVTP